MIHGEVKPPRPSKSGLDGAPYGVFYEEDDRGGLPATSVDKLRKMLMFLDAIEHRDEMRSFPGWKPHLLRGGRQATWSLRVTRNWRLTFWIDEDQNEICDVNFEDYH